MKIGIYGGTFNPPHVGHIQGARYALQTLGLDLLLMIPAQIAPHKQIPEGSPSGEVRLRMLQLGLGEEEKIQTSDLELRREGTSYTYLTVNQLREQYPEAEIYLLIGTDMFLSFSQWKYPEKIMEKTTLVVLYRGERGEREAIEEKKQELEKQGGKILVLDNPVVSISSTDLRRMLVFGCADPFLPPAVGEYIRENRLYGTRENYRNLPLEKLEKVVVSLLKPNRVKHVLGCRDTAVALAKRWGADETDAGRAGILHDITKALDGGLQLTLCREYGTMLDTFSAQNPKTLHALTGSLVAERIFGENPAVVSAIRSHTTGKANMNLLEKIIYVADYMEPNRSFPGVEKLRELAFTDIDGALRLGLEMTLALLKEQNRMISPESRQALDYLKQNHRAGAL